MFFGRKAKYETRSNVFVKLLDKEVDEFTVPEGVREIEAEAFSDCSQLKSIVIPAGVTSIGRGAFWGCSSLSSLTIPSSVTSIGDRAFFDCSNLTLRVPKGSYAERYAKENKIKYETF